MNPILSSGIMIGVACAVWTLVMGYSGLYKDPSLAGLFFLVIPIEIAGLVWGLRQTGREGKTYAGQIVAGTMMAIVAGVIIIASSLLFTTVLFPNYSQDLERMYRETLQQQGKTATEIAAAVQGNAASWTPMAQAMSGFIGTLVTGILGSAVIGYFVRRKP
jgi:TM2 domain-containing membrane protein YozV